MVRKHKRPTASSNAKEIKWLKKNVEFKFKDTTFNDLDVNDASTTQTLNLIADGPLVDERDGEEVTARRLMIRGFFHNDQGTPVDCIIRMIIWRQISVLGVTPVLGMVNLSLDVDSLRHMARKENVVVYLDETFTMDTTQHSLIPFKFIKKLNHKARFQGTTGTQSDLFRNGINISLVSTVNGVANDPLVNFTARYSYCDS